MNEAPTMVRPSTPAQIPRTANHRGQANLCLRREEVCEAMLCLPLTPLQIREGVSVWAPSLEVMNCNHGRMTQLRRSAGFAAETFS